MGLKPQYYLDHPALGRVLLCINARARRYIARVRDGAVVLTAPPGLTRDDILRALDQLSPQLLALLSAPRAEVYPEGFSYDGPDWKVRVVTDPDLRAGRVVTQYDPAWPQFVISRAPGVEDRTVGRAMENVAIHVADRLVVPVIEAEAARLGLRIGGTRVYRGRTTLGTCTAGGRISVNARTAFLPDRLRRAVVTHELTHLTHFDHSEAFYRLWESYYGAPVRPLRAELRAFEYPLPPA